jgi:ATP-dependent helicase/nuclease subunit A
VDEFQDTSTLQWSIIEMLTEEWRSGMGAKREAGKTPTIFLVGDEKQSIYLFRGANVGIFEKAKGSFAEWLGEEYHFIQAKDNYRSLPAIVDFTNRLFEKLMPPMLVESWMTRYSPFEAARKEGEGRVELLLLEACESTKDTRAKEAEALACAISSLRGRHEVFENGVKRPCEFGDMAVLLRRRTHLGLFEDALRKEGVPFIVLKGIGFYEEPETAMLREFVSFMVDPSDDYSLFCLLRSPLFSLDYGTLERLASKRVPLLEKLGKSKSKRLSGIYETMEGWLSLRSGVPLAELLERVFQDTGGWTHFREKQRHANIKKFIAMVEGYEAQGLSPVEIREKFLRQRHAREEAKANINAEGMDAVKIMTIHAAKGLQFPMVYLPSLDEKNSPRSSPVVIDDTEGRLAIAHEEDPKQRNRDERFRRQKLKEIEEEKRLFYVAVTRAMDYLCMIGSHKEGKLSGRLDYLSDAFELFDPGADAPLSVLRKEDLKRRRKKARISLEKPEPFMHPPAFTEPLLYEPSRQWKDVTEVETDTVRTRHGENRVLTGTVMHRLLEELSTGALRERDIAERAVLLLRGETPESGAVAEVILKDFGKLRESGLMEEIVLPRKNSHAELPFVLEKGGKAYRGRIDRVIIKGDTALVYDYKTFPVAEGEIAGLKESYWFQMSTYAEAVERLFNLKTRAYLVLTHVPKVVEVK